MLKLLQMVIMLGRRLHGGTHLAGDDVALHQVAHVIDQQTQPILRQVAQLGRHGIDHVLHDDGRLEGDPQTEQQQRRHAAPEGRLKAVIDRQGVQIPDPAMDQGKGPFTAQVKGQGAQTQQHTSRTIVFIE